jgi:hypothetical protein
MSHCSGIATCAPHSSQVAGEDMTTSEASFLDGSHSERGFFIYEQKDSNVRSDSLT